MIRTQIQLTERQARELKELAARENGTPAAGYGIGGAVSIWAVGRL